MELPIHTLAGIVPLANQLEQNTLNYSIATTGFDLTLGRIKTWNGSIVDGRCRQIALLKAGLNPIDYAEEIPYTTQEEVRSFVLKANNRRNLTDTQKTIAAYKLTKLSKKDGKITQTEAYTLFGIQPRTLQAVGSIVRSIAKLTENPTYSIVYYSKLRNSSDKEKTRSLSGFLLEDLFNDSTVRFEEYDRGTTSIRTIAKHLKTIGEDVQEQSAIEWNPDSMIKSEAGKQWYATATHNKTLDTDLIMYLIELANFKFPLK